MYKFSVPMPYTKQDINKFLNINNLVEKSKITSMYACVPRGCEVFTGFEQSRNIAFKNTSWDYWKGLIEYVLSCNCDFIYLINSPRPLELENPEFPNQLEKLELLLNELRKLCVNKLRVANGQLMSYIGKHYCDFEVLASTSLEYKTIWEYQNFIEFHPEVKQIVPSHDINKNFKLLSLLKKHYPNMEFELMVNEGCLQGCPNRIFHEMLNIDKSIMINNDICLSTYYNTRFCSDFFLKYPFASVIIGIHIFPWDIEEYSKIGINNFKLVGRDMFLKYFENYLSSYTFYLKGIDNVQNIKNNYLNEFIHHLDMHPVLKQLKVKEYRKFLPSIKHFVKNGHLCASRCGVECKYCYNLSNKMQKYFMKKLKEEKRKNIPYCVVND